VVAFVGPTSMTPAAMVPPSRLLRPTRSKPGDANPNSRHNRHTARSLSGVCGAAVIADEGPVAAAKPAIAGVAAMARFLIGYSSIAG
jgi:hypothetical protein